MLEPEDTGHPADGLIEDALRCLAVQRSGRWELNAGAQDRVHVTMVSER